MQSAASSNHLELMKYRTYKRNLVLLGGAIVGFLLFASMLFEYFMLLHYRAFFLGFETYCFLALVLLTQFALTLQLRIRSPIQPIPFKSAFAAVFIFSLIAGLTWALTSALYIRYIDQDFPSAMQSVTIRNLSRRDQIGAEWIAIGYDPVFQLIMKVLLSALWGLFASLVVAAIDRVMPLRRRGGSQEL